MNIHDVIDFVRMGNKGQQGGMIDGIIQIAIMLTVFAVTYPLLDEMVNTLQNSVGTTVDTISAMYLPIAAIVIILAIKDYLTPRRESYSYTG